MDDTKKRTDHQQDAQSNVGHETFTTKCHPESTDPSPVHVKASLLEKENDKREIFVRVSRRQRCISCIDWSVAQNLHVMIVFFFCTVYCLAVSSHFAFCGALVQQNGLSADQASYLLSIGGLSDIIGNIILGILFDISFVRRRSTQFYCVLNGLLAAVMILLPLLRTFPILCVAFALWGVLSTSSTTRNVVLSEHVKKENLADAVGISLMGMAIGYGSGPFITGKLPLNHLVDSINVYWSLILSTEMFSVLKCFCLSILQGSLWMH